LLIRRTLRQIIKRRGDLSTQARAVLEAASADLTRGGVVATPVPVDPDSRLALLTREITTSLPVEPVWVSGVWDQLESVVKERRRTAELEEAGLSPTRSLLFVGPPGVGKTLAAKWIAREIGRPLLTLDLAAVMSSFLGRTGNNIRAVLDFAKKAPSVLLLDEFDAIAKRRDDSGEIGELKRLVTVLLQAVDEWPADGLLIAASNHPDLLDPAIWRRFDRVVHFPLPGASDIRLLIERHVGEGELDAATLDGLVGILSGESFAEIDRLVYQARRAAVLEGGGVRDHLTSAVAKVIQGKSLRERLALARALQATGYSQRRVSEITGLSRDTIRRHRTGVQTNEG
jgi:SpoVK/Ycf46/Vps4 family AAA+-type ATPase